GRDLAGVVLAVSHQDDDPALGVQFPQTVQPGRDCRADGGPVLNGPELELVQTVQQERMVEGQRGGDIGAPGKGDKADAVIGPPADESAEDVLGGIDAIGSSAVQVKV